MYRIAICDDNLDNAKYLEKLIHKICGQKHALAIQIFQSGEDMIHAMNDEIDLVIMDMEMEGLSGYETAKILRSTNKQFILALCTGIVTPEAKFYDLKVLRYIMKDDPEEEIIERLTSLLEEIDHRRERRAVFFYGQGKGMSMRFDVDDILYIEHYKRKNWICVTQNAAHKYGSERIEIRESMEEAYAKVRRFGFGYSQYSFIANFSNIIGIKGRMIYFIYGKSLAISRRYKQQFEQDLRDFIREG